MSWTISPRPWSYDIDEDMIYINDASDEIVARIPNNGPEAKANAQLIVNACNAMEAV